MQTSTPPIGRHQQNSGLNHYLTLIANLLKISSSRASLLKRVLPILEGNAGSYE
jgi:hypothetical protein